ncbi:VPS35 endosomal protein sorting factor-like isoform X4 [Eucalyptus grandis]|uniref:VPS35 endosomal protein sorting factor-like isoform X4 n=1 Tax=Eucalyptus grandis TaxID=71139 RepID=UPI00192EA87D|nr:VPS35 endosomal protein sorting factor-like isoform X4 [Eucalyptus grandis]XP_039171624.1 VPS35 endosomal protein sorting factor-like isoform X4 [Eucalyptus grandis]
MEFRPRNYKREKESRALPRARADDHPLCTPATSRPQAVRDNRIEDFFDPLRGPNTDVEGAPRNLPDKERTSGGFSAERNDPHAGDWHSFKRLLMQRFPISKMISISSISDGIMKSNKVDEISSTSSRLEELDDPQKFAKEGNTSITRQEYVFRLTDFKEKIVQAWHSDDRVTALKLTIKVARLLMDTSVRQFYPTLFVLATDVMDMLGDMVWERIKQKAEFTVDGSKLCSLAENFDATGVCEDAKETCNNWFYKVGAIMELLPRIYLELAILPCFRFLLVQPADCLHRLVKMIRGLADPLSSAYCRLYMVHRARKLLSRDTAYLITCMNDMNILLMDAMSLKRDVSKTSEEKKRLLINLIEPTIEYIVHHIFEDTPKEQLATALVDLGLGGKGGNKVISCVSIVAHCYIKELPADMVRSKSKEIINLIECCNDCSLDKCLNYRLLGFRLSETTSPQDMVDVVDHVIQVVLLWGKLDEFLKVMDAFLDLVLQNQMDNHILNVLEGIAMLARDKAFTEEELGSLQSILVKLVSHFEDLEDLFGLNHYLEILDMMYGRPRSIVNVHILDRAIRKGLWQDHHIIQLLFGISKSLMDEIDQTSMIDNDYQQPARLISRFVSMVDYGSDVERHLAFLAECRGAFGSINELKEALVHSSNSLAIQGLKHSNKHFSFIMSCIAYSEVTIPSISSPMKQSNLYIETAEVALLGGLVSHAEGLAESAVSCLQSLVLNGSPGIADVEGILSSFQKLCSLLVMVPGRNSNTGPSLNYAPKSLFVFSDSQSKMIPRTTTRLFSAIILLSAALSQETLPYHADNFGIPGNDQLFYGDSSYSQELLSISNLAAQKLVDAIQQEPSSVARGIMALEACNCIASSFRVLLDALTWTWQKTEKQVRRETG